MITTENKEKIFSIISEQLGIEKDKIELDSSFQDMNADSLDVVELVMALEDEFDIEIPDADAEKMNKVNDVLEYISVKIGEGSTTE